MPKSALAPLRALGKPIADVIGVQPYAAWQTAFDPLLTPGAFNYWKSHNFTALSDGLLDTLVDYVGTLPTAECEIFIGQLGGRHQPRSRRCDRLSAPRRQFRDERAHAVARARRRAGRDQMGA